MDFIGLCLFVHLVDHEMKEKDPSKLLIVVFGSFAVLHAISASLAFFGLDMKID